MIFIPSPLKAAAAGLIAFPLLASPVYAQDHDHDHDDHADSALYLSWGHYRTGTSLGVHDLHGDHYHRWFAGNTGADSHTPAPFVLEAGETDHYAAFTLVPSDRALFPLTEAIQNTKFVLTEGDWYYGMGANLDVGSADFRLELLSPSPYLTITLHSGDYHDNDHWHYDNGGAAVYTFGVDGNSAALDWTKEYEVRFFLNADAPELDLNETFSAQFRLTDANGIYGASDPFTIHAVHAIPEPGTYALIALSGGLLALQRYRKRESV